MLFAFVISLAALLARFPFAFGYTLADGGFSDSLHLINVGHHPLDIRQLGQGVIPSQCSSICNPVSASLNANCTAVQCCTSSFEEQVFQCLTCLEGVLHETNFTKPQTMIDGFYNACTTLGFSLPILTFPGQNANRPLSSASSTRSQSTTSVSQTTGAGTSLVNPYATISQTAVTSLSTTTQPPTSTSSSTSTSTTRATSSGRKIEVGILVWVWMQAMGGVLIFILNI